MTIGIVFLCALVIGLVSIFWQPWKPKRLTGAALQAYIRELEYDTEIVERPTDIKTRLERAATRAELDAIAREIRVDPRIWGGELLDIPSPADLVRLGWNEEVAIRATRDKLGRFDNAGNRIQIAHARREATS